MSKKNIFIFSSLIGLMACQNNSKFDARAAIQDALEKKDLQKIIKTLQSAPDIKDLRQFIDHNGDNLLHLIVTRNAIDSFRKLTSEPDYMLPYNEYNDNYTTPLSQSVAEGKCQLAELLMIKGADPSIIPYHHVSALVTALANNQDVCAESIALRPKTVDQEIADGWRAVHYAAYIGNTKALKVLLKYHPNPDIKVSIENGAPYYSEKGFQDLGNVNILQIAILMGHVEAAKIILKNYPEYIYQETSMGMNNMQLADMSNSPAMIAWVSAIEPKIDLDKERAKNLAPKPRTRFQADMDEIAKDKNNPVF